MVFGMNRFSFEMSREWVELHGLTFPVLYDPDPSETYWLYAHNVLPQNTLTDRHFEVIHDEEGAYSEAQMIQLIEENLYPVAVAVDSPVEAVARGDAFTFDVALRNWGAGSVSFDAWIDVILPNHRLLPNNPQIGPIALTMAPAEELTRTFAAVVPRFAVLADNYRIKISIGAHGEDEIFNCDLLEIDVVE